MVREAKRVVRNLSVLAALSLLAALPFGCQASTGAADPSPESDKNAISYARVRPKISLVSVEIMGLRSKAEVRATLEGALPKIQSCYEQVAKELPRKPGRLLAQLTVYPNGTATSPQILGGQFSHHGFEGCLSTELKDLSFENKPRSGTSEVMLALELMLDIREIKTLD